VILNTRLQEDRFFYYIVKGKVMVFTVKNTDLSHSKPELYNKLGPNEYFGEKTTFGHNELHEARSLSFSYILKLDITTFYNAFSGHFQYS
jgi:CRP-like cAMP-binding protein